MDAQHRDHETERLFARSSRLIQLSRHANRRLDVAAEAVDEILIRQATSTCLVWDLERSVGRSATDLREDEL